MLMKQTNIVNSGTPTPGNVLPSDIVTSYSIVQGVVIPGEAEVAWLNACMGGINGFLSIFIGIGIAS